MHKVARRGWMGGKMAVGEGGGLRPQIGEGDNTALWGVGRGGVKC